MKRCATDIARHRRLTRAVIAAAAGLLLAGLPAAPANAADRKGYEIINSISGLRADVMWGSTNAFQGVFLWPNSKSASQEFDLLDSGDGNFRIRARHSGQCLMLDSRGGTAYPNATHIVQNTCKAGNAAAEWRERRVSGTTGDETVLVNRRTGKCLDADNDRGGRPSGRAVLQQWTCVRSANAWNIGNQAWDIRRSGSVILDD